MLSEADIFGHPVEDLVEHILGIRELTPLRLNTNQLELAEEGELKSRIAVGPGQTVTTKANFYVFAVPFTGDTTWFEIRPSKYSYSVPRGNLHASELRISVLLEANETGKDLKRKKEEAVRELTAWVENLRTDIEEFNAELPRLIRLHLEKRRLELERLSDIRREIEVPIRPRPDVSSFTPIPLVKKRPPKPLQSTGTPYLPEPALLDAHYEHILESLQHMSEAIELSPTTFYGLSENDIRNILLVSLNCSYKGNATGETFSKGGKADIFVTENGKCIFIAECKFWKGPASLTGAIDQLLGYTTWRNTKTAILLFNKNKGITEVLEKIVPTVEAHGQFKRTVSKGPGESIFRFAIKNKEDPDRELQVAVLVFDIPSGKASADSQID